MPRKPRTPSLRRHSAKSRAVVTLNGTDHYLGPWPASQTVPSPAVTAAYHRLIAEWEARGRRPAGENKASPGGGPAASPDASGDVPAAPGDLTINELILAFWKHAEVYYRRPDGTHTNELDEFRLSFRPLKALYGSTPAKEFGPLRLKAVRENMIKADLCRNLINKRVSRIVRMFAWALSEELVEAPVLVALRTVKGLEEGRSNARESEPVEPVPDDVVDKTLPFLSPVVRAMVQVQRLTGARPGEVCSMKPELIDRSTAVWVFRPDKHKTRHKGKTRAIAIGPKAQEILRPFLEGREPDAYLFSPRETMEAHWAALRAKRQTKVQPSQQTRRKARPKKKPGMFYKVAAYCYAIAKACIKAEAPHWHPHQLRHTRATEVRKAYGLEAAQVSLGHSQAQVTEVYAERDLTLASKVAAEIG
jgi:integrase